MNKINLLMKEAEQQPSSEYDIVIIQCCENCETHQNISRHSEWKYFEQFNEIKRKIEKFIPNTIVIKNPVPDQLIKTPEIKNDKNLFVNKETNQPIIYPRIGSFEVYIYNVLISSKLLANQWPNHYKILQVITKVIEEKKKGNPLDKFSVYNQPVEPQNQPENKETAPISNESPEKKNVRISSKKKKGPHGLTGKAYRSIDRGYDGLKDLKSTLDPISFKAGLKDDISPQKGKRNVHRYLLESKGDTRVRLPALINTMENLKDDYQQDKKGSQKKINPINEMEQEDLSMIENKHSDIYESRKFSLLELKSEEIKNNSIASIKQDQLKFVEDHSVQYSEPEGKDLMNRSIQYEEEEGFYCDFGMQIDQDNLNQARQMNYQWVQTDRVQLTNQPKPYTLEEEVQANIIIKVPNQAAEAQTIIKEFVDTSLGTQIVITVNRQLQFPQETARSVNLNEIIDTSFQHLYQKRRNILDSEDSYSIDRFEEKSTKYKWVGRAKLNDDPDFLKKKMFVQCLVFSVYNYYGIKTPEKRLSYQMCSNVVGEKLKEGLLHILTFDNPELQYVTQFQDFDYHSRKFPVSEIITFRSSKQNVKFNNYGGFLALAYFLNDYEIFSGESNHVGFVIVNETVKQIHKLSALNYKIHPSMKSTDQDIIINLNNQALKINRLSETVELQFFSMLSRISDPNTFEELLKYIREIFVHQASAYQQFKKTLLSLNLESSEDQTVEDFIKMLESRLEKVKEMFKGKLYTYKKYHTLTPTIKYSVPFEHKIERKLHFKDKIVTVHDIVKHLRNNNTLLIIQGEEGSGKTTLLTEMAKQLKSADKINLVNISWLKEPLKGKEEMFQLSKNVILIDNAQHFQSEVIDTLQFISKKDSQISICLSTTNFQQKQIIKNRCSTLNIVSTTLIPLNSEQIKDYFMKVLKFKSYTDKKDLVESLTAKPQYLKVLENPFFLSLLCSNISSGDNLAYQFKDTDITKYSILKEAFSSCVTAHSQEMRSMGLQIKEALPNLRRIAFEYFHHGQQCTVAIKDIVAIFQEDQLIRSQLVYYPINLDSIISASYQSLFTHSLFFKYFLIEAYSYFVQKGFRNMRMEKIYSDHFLLNFIIQRYKIQNTYSQLLEVVLSTKKFKTISEASSNAITLLSKMNYVFSNVNFDDCILPSADLSNSIFYQCSFRGADLEEAILYKAQMISCTFDGAAMSRINLFSKKYEIEFTAMTCSISLDNKRLAFGCGNYLIIMNAETGAEIKRIEAHLDVIRLVKYTRDGNSLVTIADDKTLRIWDIYTYKSVVFKLPQKGSISYSNQTQTIASVTKNTLKVWNLKSMANEAELQGHTEPITTIEFSYDGQLILTGSRDSTLRLWTLKGKQIVVFKGHDNEVTVGKLSPAKRTMVSSSKGKDLIMWAIESGSKLVSKKFMSEVNQICLENKEKYILVTFSNDNHIVVLDFLTLEIIHALTGHEAKIVSLHFDHNFKQLISLGKDRTARVWQFDQIIDNEIKHPKITKKIKKGPVLAIAYDKVKQIYATSHQNGEINIWKAQDNTLLEQVISHSGPVRCLAIDRSSKIYSGGSDGSLRIWNLQAKKQPRTIEIHSSEMIQLRLSERNRFIATSSTANELVIHDFTGIKIIMSTREEGRVSAITFSLDEKLMAVGGSERYVVLYEVLNSNSVNRTVELGQHSDAITALTFFGDFLLVVALKNGQVAIWNHHRTSLIKKIENVSPIRNLLQFQKKFICFTTEDGKIRIVNMDEGKEIRVFRYSEAPTSIDVNQDQSLLITGTDTGNILKWNLNCVRPPSKKIEFDRKAIDQECSRIVTVQSGRTLLIKDLFYHREQVVDAKVDSDIEGVTFDGDKIILLLKNGKYWEYGKREYKFNNSESYEGDLHSIRDRHWTNFFKSGIKKIKGMNKPSLAILQEINHL